MIVYTLELGIDYEGKTVIGVYSSFEKATEAKTELERRHYLEDDYIYADGFYITSFELDSLSEI